MTHHFIALYSGEQARATLLTPTVESDQLIIENDNIPSEISILKRQNSDLRTEVSTFKDLISKSDQAEAAVLKLTLAKKEKEVRRLQADLTELMQKIASAKNFLQEFNVNHLIDAFESLRTEEERKKNE